MGENTTQKPGVTKKAGEIKEGGIVIQNLTIRPIERSKIDILDWRTRHKQAESINGSRVSLYDLYSDALLDGFLKRLIAKRVLSVTKNKLKYIDKSGKEVDGASDIIKTREFRKLRQRIQLYKAWGNSVIELMAIEGKLKIFDVPKKHINPKDGLILYQQYGVDGIPYRQPPYNRTVIEVGDWDDLGYLLEACCYVIYKRGVIADWANYSQIFGMPFREARYDGFNDVVRMQLETAMEKAASAAWAVLPKDAEFKLHEASNASGSNELYDSLRRAMNEELSVLILGATETTTSSKSSGYAQSSTHADTVKEVEADDKQDELSILNEQVVPVLALLGLLPPDGVFVYDEPLDVDTASKKVDMGLKMKKEGIPVGDDWFYQTSGIPKPDNYDELKQEIKDAKPPLQPEPPAPDKKPPIKSDPGKSKKVPAAGKKSGKLTIIENLRVALADFFDQAHES